MSLLVQAMTSEDDAEITQCLSYVRNSSLLGLVHESVHVDYISDYTSRQLLRRIGNARTGLTF